VFADLSWAKLFVLMLVALLVLGPERLPGLAADAGRLLRQLRQMANGLRDDLKSELGPELGEVDLTALHPRRFVEKHLFGDEETPPAATTAAASELNVLPAGVRPPYDPDAT